jgi:hypothetical protein
MQATIIGPYNTRPKSRGSNLHVMDVDYITVLDCGHILVMAKDVGETDGASIPWWARWAFGSGRSGFNREWGCPHDGLYKRCIYIFWVDPDAFDHTARMFLARNWRTHLHGKHEVAEWPTRKWCDRVMKAVMEALDVPRFKCAAVYRAVRVGGWWAWRKGRG